MKIAYLLKSVSRKAGGMFEICRRLAASCFQPEEVAVLGSSDEYTGNDLAKWEPLQPRVFDVVGPSGFGYAPGYFQYLDEIAPDLAHVHGLWTYSSYCGSKWQRRTGRPLIYTVHGMLDPWALRNSRWKKLLTRLAWENDAHRRASCFHVNSEAEFRTVHDYGIRCPVCVIPNGIDLPDLQQNRVAPWNADGRKVLLYLGRLHPKKNLVALIDAWKRERREDWLLVIAGWDEVGYESTLRKHVRDLGIEHHIHFAGALFGGAKEAAYQNADAFVLPSLSEGLPMVVLEAWSFVKPVVMTPECNLPEGFASHAAFSVGQQPDEIGRGLRELLNMTDADRGAMGARGYTLVSEQFAWPAIGREMRAVYQWILGEETQPASIRLP